MSDPHDIPGRKQPPRAEPLQPDKPSSGGDAESDRQRDAEEAAATRLKSQTQDALDNVREGYK